MATTATQDVQEQILSTVRKGQEIALEALKTWVDTVQAFTPKVPAISIPLADQLPKPQDVVANAYDFAGQVLADQRKFAEEVLKTTASLLPGSGQGTPAAK